MGSGSESMWPGNPLLNYYPEQPRTTHCFYTNTSRLSIYSNQSKLWLIFIFWGEVTLPLNFTMCIVCTTQFNSELLSNTVCWVIVLVKLVSSIRVWFLQEQRFCAGVPYFQPYLADAGMAEFNDYVRLTAAAHNDNSFSPYYMPGAHPRISLAVTSLSSYNTPIGRYSYYPHFTEEKSLGTESPIKLF